MRFIRNLLILVLIAKAISLVMLWYFQGEGVHHHANHSKLPEYKRYNANNLIKPTKKPDIKEATEPTSEEAKELAAYGPNISNMVLKGLFKRKDGGIVIIALKAKPNDSEVISIGESFQKYTLTRILKNGAIFTKNGKTFTLYFSEDRKEDHYAKAPSRHIQDDDEIKQVAKADIVRYAKNVKQIWKDIGIVEVKKAGKITGFRVTRIKANTPFAQLGLRKGDIIIKANNKEMTSYKDAIAIYKGIDKLEALELVVLRNNQETEINYEIY
jgi:type II secretion system protein C